MEPDNNFAVNSALPYCTDDAILANCLLVAGFKETALSPRNIYTEEILFKAGGGKEDESGKIIRSSRFSGMKLIEGAKTAWRERLKGRVEYHFEHSPEIAYFVAAYRDQSALIFASGEDMDAGKAVRDLMHLASEGDEQGVKMDEREALLRVLCVVLKLRIPYVNRWKNVVPSVFIREAGKPSTSPGRNGGQLQTFPGGKLVPVNANNELLTKMELL